ncbi:MAG: methylated-DNA--[protein]-cysteine S-methyltransferase [Propionibacteriaceae bacterium]|nr:methylated-DNA--[protein]-cysteine S-methyltransferase [Propionibacteriaceae bacterium]
MDCAIRTLTSPDGPFTIITGTDAVLASGWTANVDSLVALIHPSLRPDPQIVQAAWEDATTSANAHREGGAAPGPGHATDPPIIEQACAAVEAYYHGSLSAPVLVPVAQRGGPFHTKVWVALRTILAGQPLTYADLAERAGNPPAIRAAGSACARNAVALFVPCHRVVKTDRSIGGFRYGPAIKESLLTRESGPSARG